MNARRAVEDLKIACLATGARVSAAALDAVGGPANVTVHEYATTGGLPIKVEGLDLNVPFDEWYCEQSDVEIDVCDGHLVARHGADEWTVETVYPLPSYLDQRDARGRRYGDVAYTHIDRVRISPISGCAYDCAFCDLPGRITLAPADFLIDALHTALDDGRFDVRHALISGGSPGPRHEAEFERTVLRVVAEFAGRIEIDVMMAASRDAPRFVRQLVDVGAHGFAINIELESERAGAVHIRGKRRRSRPYFDQTVGTAVELLGSTGRVRSLILPGLEPVEDTLDGVRHIAGLGADPVLSPFRPALGTRLAEHSPVDEATLREVLDAAREIAAACSVRLGPRCLPCQHNTLSFPWDVA